MGLGQGGAAGSGLKCVGRAAWVPVAGRTAAPSESGQLVLIGSQGIQIFASHDKEEQ